MRRVPTQKRGAGAEGPPESGWPHEKGPHVGEAPCLVYRAHSFPVTRRKVYAHLPPDRHRYFQAAVFNSVSFTVAFNVLTFKVGFHLDRNPAFRRLTGRYGREYTASLSLPWLRMFSCANLLTKIETMWKRCYKKYFR